MNLLCGNLKDASAKMVLHAFGLADLSEAEMAKCVQELLEQDQYIFPIDPKVTSVFVSTAVAESPFHLQTKRIIANKPFHHPIFVSLLHQEFFKNASSFRVEYRKYFSSSLADRPEQEIPMSLIALVATCVQPMDDISYAVADAVPTGVCRFARIYIRYAGRCILHRHDLRRQVSRAYGLVGEVEDNSTASISSCHVGPVCHGVRWKMDLHLLTSDQQGQSPLVFQDHPVGCTCSS